MDAEGKTQTIGFWSTTALVVGTIVGSGIFLLPVSLAPLGANALVGWIVSGAGVLCIAYGLARLSRLSGEGIQANVEREFGATVAFCVTWCFWVSYWVAVAAVALAAASAMSFISPALLGPASIVPVSIGWVLVLTGVNTLGVRAVGGFSIITVAIKLVPMLAVVWLFGERGLAGPPLEPFLPVEVTFANVATATALTFFAFTGFESVTAPVGKVRNPEITIPRALIGGTAFVVALYLVAATALQLMLPYDTLAASTAPFADALVSRWGGGVATLAAFGIVVAAVGCLNGLILATGELGYSMALRGDLPQTMARARADKTPVASLWVGTALAVVLLLANASRTTAGLYTFTVLLSTASMIVVYFVVVLASWKVTARTHQRAALILALAFIAFATWGLGLEAIGWTLVLLAGGLVIRAGMHRLNARVAEGE